VIIDIEVKLIESQGNMVFNCNFDDKNINDADLCGGFTSDFAANGVSFNLYPDYPLYQGGRISITDITSICNYIYLFYKS
jgi:hypothetical protein